MMMKPIDNLPHRSGSGSLGLPIGACFDLPSVAGRRAVAGGLALVLMSWTTLSWSEPQGGKVVRGKAEITTGKNLTVNQKSNRAIIDWSSFSIGADESVTFKQPSAKAVILNRVTGDAPSNILGTLTANGHVTLVSPKGINFGSSAKVDVAGLVATTANITNQDFMDGRDRFLEPALASSFVVNQGEISVGSEVVDPDGRTVREGGLAAFVAPWVVNSGTINARLGVVTLASGDRFTIDLFGDRLVQLQVKPKIVAAAFGLDDVEAPEALVTVAQQGVIQADGGKVIVDVGNISLDVASATSIVDNAINMDGLVEARTVDMTSGQIVLRGRDVGPIRIAGKLDASGSESGQRGGQILVTGAEPARLEDEARFDISGEARNGRIKFEPLAFQTLSVSSEAALQERLDKLFVDKRLSVREENIPFVHDEQPMAGTVTLIIEDASFASDNIFGLYEVGNEQNRIPLFPLEEAKPGAQATFRIDPGPGSQFTVFVNGELKGQLASRDYGYYLDTSRRTGGGLFFSDRSLNPDINTPVHVGNYEIGGFSYAVEDNTPQTLRGQRQPIGSRLLLWEDLALPLDAPEPDFNDFIVNVRAEPPVDPPPPECVEGSCLPPPVPCVLNPFECVAPEPGGPTVADDPGPRPSDPWNFCESWRDDRAVADIEVARCYAALTLETLGAHARTAFAELSAVLADPSPRNRALAARDLGRISASLNAATSVLVGVLASPDDGVAAQAAAIMEDAREYADLVVPALDKAADDEEVVVARAALQGLGDLGSYATTALPTFTGAFESEDLGVRYYAADGISKVDREMRATAIAIGQVSAAGDETQSLVRELEAALQKRPQYSRDAIETLADIGPEARGASQGSIDKLASPDPAARVVAAEELGAINRFAAASVPALVEALGDPANQQLREDLTIPGEGPSSYVEVAVDPLFGSLNDRQPEVRRATAQSLGQLNAVTAEAELALRAARGDDEIAGPITRRTLTTIDEYDGKATEVLLAALKDDDPAVSRAAVQALGALGDGASGAVPALIAAVKSGDTGLQTEAELALGRIGADPEETVPTLVDALQNSDEPAVRYHAARALGLLGEQARAATPELRGAMNEGDAGLRYQAALALWSIDPAAAIDSSDLDESKEQTEKEVEQLLAAFKGEDPSAGATLASIGPAAISAVPEIVAALTTAAPEQRDDLASLLSSISSDGLAEVPILIEVLQSRSGEPAARARAAERLGNISAEAKKAVPALTGGLKNEDLSVRFALAGALGNIGHHTTATTRALVAAAGSDTSSQVRREATESLRREARAALEAKSATLTRGKLYEIDRALTN